MTAEALKTEFNGHTTGRHKIKKVVQLETNFNQKMGCDCFIHLALAPGRHIPESELATTLVDVVTQDGSHPPVECRLVDLGRFNLAKTTSLLAQLSHGMDANAFIDYVAEKFTGITPVTEMAAYYYTRTKQVENKLQ